MKLHSTEVKTARAAWRRFWTMPSPRWLTGCVAVALGARLLIGDFTWRDPVIAAGLIAVHPSAEWWIHVHLLHLKPFRLRGREVEIITSKEHRWHHERPHDLYTVLLGAKEVVGLMAGVVPLVGLAICGLLWLAGGGFEAAAILTALVAGGLLVFTYEWTHFLIHTAHRPKTRVYRAVWRTHRLHHFKNEHFWHGITSTIADRVLRTNPDPRAVERSPTARTLDPNAQVVAPRD